MCRQSPALLTQEDHSLKKWKGCVSEKVVKCTGSPQGTVSLCFCSSFVYMWWTRGWVLGTGWPLCGIELKQSFHLEQKQSKIDDNWFWEDQEWAKLYFQSGRSGRGVPGCSNGQQTELEIQHWDCLQEGTGHRYSPNLETNKSICLNICLNE